MCLKWLQCSRCQKWHLWHQCLDFKRVLRHFT
nr:MAG TPA: Histone-lysine N-methyltransferase ASHH2 [Bacteriophage sp.]